MTDLHIIGERPDWLTGAPKPARYEPRKLADRCGVFDTFTQRFVEGEECATWGEAVSASARINRAYGRAVGR